jgi:hemolysin type calcium-binding protein
MRLSIALPVLAALAAPAAAGAATATSDPSCGAERGEVPQCYVWSSFTAAAGEANDLSIAFSGASFTYYDAGATIAVANCSRPDDHTATCGGDAAVVKLLDGDDRIALPDVSGTTRPVMQPIKVLLGEGNDVAAGGAVTDDVAGEGGDDVLRGLGGADALAGGPGADLVDGGEGNDRLSVADVSPDPAFAAPATLAPPAPDRIDGGPGADVASWAGEQRGIDLDLATGLAAGGAAGDVLAGIEGVAGGSGGNRISGDEQPNTIIGGDGGNRLAGRGGDDVLVGGTGVDTIDGGEGDDRLVGGQGSSDLLFGGPGDDELTLGSGGVADAGDGDDLLEVTAPPPRPLRLRCGAGEDTAQAARRASMAADCEWARLGLGDADVSVARRLLRAGRHAVVKVRLGEFFTRGRLVLRAARGGRVLGSAVVRKGAGSRVRIRLPRGARPGAVALQVGRRGPRAICTFIPD